MTVCGRFARVLIAKKLRIETYGGVRVTLLVAVVSNGVRRVNTMAVPTLDADATRGVRAYSARSIGAGDRSIYEVMVMRGGAGDVGGVWERASMRGSDGRV